MLCQSESKIFRPGCRLGLDWGGARIGVAACDQAGILAYPVETISAADEEAAIDRVAALASEYEVIEVVLGLPISLRGKEEIAAQKVIEVANNLVEKLEIPVRLIDERLTTAAATRNLPGNSRQQRLVVDQASAVGILEGALSYERHTGNTPGYLVSQLTEKEV